MKYVSGSPQQPEGDSVLFLVHHAEAVEVTADPQRPLTAAGRVHAGQLAAKARDRGVKPAVIWHSGKLRARQTAEIFLRACNPLAELAATRGIQPGDPPQWIKDVIEGESRDIMLVGHMPHLARLWELLIRPDGSGTAGLPLHGVAALSRRAEGWMDEWMLGPGF